LSLEPLPLQTGNSNPGQCRPDPHQALGTTTSHVFEIVRLDGLVYAVQFSYHSGRDLINLAKKKTTIIPLTEEAWHSHKYCMLTPMMDVIFADVA
jgi:rRNA 2'-O-methyltransferase fibrillarin